MPYRLLALVAFSLALAPALRAQPLVDGVTAGLAVSMFQGDVDANPGNGPIEYLSFGEVGAFVGVDRKFGPVIAEAVLHADRFRLENELVEMTLGSVGLDLTAGFALNVARPGLLRLFAGVSPTLLMPSYQRVSDSLDGHSMVTFEEHGTRLQVLFPVGVVIQDVLRVGVRFSPSDALDGWTSTTGAKDRIAFVSLGYRFDLLR